MSKMTAAYLGLLVLVTYFSTQVSSQNATSATPETGNYTSTTGFNSTMMQPSTSNTTANATTPKGAASFTRSGAFSVLLPVAMAASLAFNRC